MHFYQHGMVAEIFEKIGTIILLLSDSVTQKKMKEKKDAVLLPSRFSQTRNLTALRIVWTASGDKSTVINLKQKLEEKK